MMVLALLLVGTQFGGANTAQAAVPSDYDYSIKAGDYTICATDDKDTAEKAVRIAERRFKKHFEKVTYFSIKPAIRIVPFDGAKYKSCKRVGKDTASKWIYNIGMRKNAPYKVVVKGRNTRTRTLTAKTQYRYVKSWSVSSSEVAQAGRKGYRKMSYELTLSGGKYYDNDYKTIGYKRPIPKIIKKGTRTKASTCRQSSSRVVSYAKRFLGCPYVYGGNSLSHGTDCSGFVKGVYKNFGYNLPRTSGSMRSVGRGVSGGLSNARSGDIVCYPGHVAIYMGSGRIIHASTYSTGICTGSAYYTRPITVRRLIY